MLFMNSSSVIKEEWSSLQGSFKIILCCNQYNQNISILTPLGGGVYFLFQILDVLVHIFCQLNMSAMSQIDAV